MSAYSTMGDELKFQQRWEFRSKDNDFDSSTDDSKSSSMGQPIIKSHKLASNLISLDDDGTSNIRKLEKNHSSNPGYGDQLEFAKGKEKKIKKRKKKKNFVDGEVIKRDCQNEINRKKSEIIVNDCDTMVDVKNFRKSLLEDLEVTRENLFTWMKEEMSKLVADDDNAQKKEKRIRNSRGKKVQSQKCNNFKKNVKKLQQQNSIEENVQGQQQNINGAIVNFKEDNGGESHKGFKSGLRDQKAKGVVRCSKRAKSSETSDQVAAAGGLAIVPLTTMEKEKGESLALTVNSNPRSGPSSNQNNVQVKHTKSVVLAIKAQNCKDRSSVKRKRTGNSNKHNQALKDLVAKRSTTLPIEQSFPFNPTNQLAPSMYFTLPAVLTKPQCQDLNNRLATFASNYIQHPRLSGNKTTVNLEGGKQIHDSSFNFGCLPNMQTEDRRSVNFSPMGSRNLSCLFNHNGNQTSSTGTGYPVPFSDTGFGIPGGGSQFLLPQEIGNTLGLRMNGGALTLSAAGGSFALSENFLANTNTNNNLLSHSNYRADGRLAPFQIPSITDAYSFP